MSKEAAGAPSPFDLWQKIYEANEKAWSATLDKLTGTPAFAEASGKFLETMLAAQKQVREGMRSYLETINVPTREDIARLGELVIGLEEKIDQLDDRLGRIEAGLRCKDGGAPAAQAPGRRNTKTGNTRNTKKGAAKRREG